MLKPYKAIIRVVAQTTDANGNVTGEIPVADMTLFASQFAQLGERLEEAWPDIEGAHADSETG